MIIRNKAEPKPKFILIKIKFFSGMTKPIPMITKNDEFTSKKNLQELCSEAKYFCYH